ncbi:MAG: hypothetical protein QF437_07310 [Planctomycetota bacterium]|nr:hypothetical protein [Planctomycetota bacterium]
MRPEDLVTGGPAGPWRRTFLDAMVVERSEGLARIFHAAQKHAQNPVLRKDKPWEGKGAYSGPYLYGTVMRDDGKLRMWYHVYESGYRNCYAESTDGITWTKPNLGLKDYRGSKENNLFLTVSDDPNEKPPGRGSGQCHNPSVIKRPWEKDPQKRYVLFCYGVDYRKARAAFSPDGLTWKFVPETAQEALFPSGDVLNFFFDPYKNRYAATRKSGNRRGRAVAVATSRDGLKWELPTPGPVFVADDLDPDATQVYGMPVFPYQGLYIGLPWIYNARWFKDARYTDKRMYEAEKDSPCTMDVQVAWSWDLINWSRPRQRKQFIPRGRPGEFDSHMIYTARAPVVVNDQLYFYYGGWDGPHNSRKSTSNIGLAVLRLDGFCSMQAGEDEGSFISRKESFQVPRVTINARASNGGNVVAEILDGANSVIEGFAREDCIPFRGDSVRHVLQWKKKEFSKDHLEKVKKLRFYLRRADLYSYLPDQTPAPVTVIFNPSENGGLLPSDQKVPESQRFTRFGKPSGYRIDSKDGWTYADLHSRAADKTSASYHRGANWNDESDWCLEAWIRIVDRGTEPNYGLASFMNPPAGRNVALYLSDSAVGFLSTDGTDHKTHQTVKMATKDGFHWYRMIHRGGAKGTVAIEIDGRKVLSMPYQKLTRRTYTRSGFNVSFGPNAGHCEGRMHVARFGYRIGSTRPIFGPVRKEEKIRQ